VQEGRKDIQVPVATVRSERYLQQCAELHFPLNGKDGGRGPVLFYDTVWEPCAKQWSWAKYKYRRSVPPSLGCKGDACGQYWV
jgi:hypothetical protein